MAKQPPKTIKNDTLGTLRLSSVQPDQIEYSVDCQLDGESVEMTLYSAEGSQEMDQTIALACDLANNFAKVRSRLHKYVTQTVVKQVNKNLLPTTPVKPHDFLDQLELTLIDLHADGNASFWFSPADALRGHGLVLYGKSDGSVHDFDTPG